MLARIAVHAKTRTHLWLAVVIGCFCLLTFGITVTKRPWCDEGWFADIPYNLMHHGVMGLTILDPHGFVFAPLVKGIDRYTFWVMPGYIFLQAGWYWVVGLNLFTMRALSIGWGVVALVSWYLIVGRLTHSRMVALLSVVVLGVDQHFAVASSSGRMDMMCTALCLAASALYLRLRTRFHLALVAACSVLALALLTHPNALFGAILLALIVLWLDRGKIRPLTIVLAAAPFLLALGLWSLYLLRAPGLFVSQMQAQSKIPHRFQIQWNLFAHFKDEFNGRYAVAYRLYSHSLLTRLTGSVFYLYILSLLGLGAIPAIRNRPGARLILVLGVLQLGLLSCLQPNWYYLVYPLWAYSAAVAICAEWLWRQGLAARWIATLGIAAIVTLSGSVNGFRIVHNDYAHRYLPAVRYLLKNAAPRSLVMGSGELAFNLGFEGRVLDDCRLGVTSGVLPDFIVLEAQYRQFWFSWLSQYEPETFARMVKRLQNDYEMVYDQTQDPYRTLGTSDLPYQIFKRKVSVKKASVVL